MITLIVLLLSGIVMIGLLISGAFFTIFGNMIVTLFMFTFGMRMLKALSKRLEKKIEGGAD